MTTKKILILEDDLRTVGKLITSFSELEERLINDSNTDIAVTVLNNYRQVTEYLNSSIDPDFDAILLDRDCKLGGSFHALDFNKFVANRIIGISAIPEYNEDLKRVGVSKLILKDHEDLDSFVLKVTNTIEYMLLN